MVSYADKQVCLIPVLCNPRGALVLVCIGDLPNTTIHDDKCLLRPASHPICSAENRLTLTAPQAAMGTFEN